MKIAGLPTNNKQQTERKYQPKPNDRVLKSIQCQREVEKYKTMAMISVESK